MEKLLTLPVDTTIFPAHWLHASDGSLCTTPRECSAAGRELYVKAGAPASVWRHMDDDSICETPHECSALGRYSWLSVPLDD